MMFVIRNDKGELIHRSVKPILDPRATEEPDSDEKVIDGIIWIVRDGSAKIEQCVPTYPHHPAAIALAIDDPELQQFNQANLGRAQLSQRRKDAWRRIRDRLIDDEIARISVLPL
jgi:hypothetical protein